MLEHKDYLRSLNKARRKNRGGFDPRWLLILLGILLAAGLIVLTVRTVWRAAQGGAPVRRQTESQITGREEDSAAQEAEKEAEAARAQEAQEIQAVIDSYSNLGIAQVSGYLNIRETAGTDGTIIGKLQGDAACEILDTEGEWSHITSGGVEGYINNQYLITGDEAKQRARELVKLRATVTTDGVNIRSAPTTDDYTNITGQALAGEKYTVVSQDTDGWVQIEEGYISADYVTVAYGMNEGRKLDMKSMAINQYKNLVISKVNKYLNVRAEPSTSGKVIGKMTSKAGGEILETLDGWYKVQSGPVVGYITADPQYTATGQEAKDLAMQAATLKAVIKTDVLNVRTEPNTDAKIWTQIIKDERYSVLDQLDGWVQIDLDSVDEEDGSEGDKAYISTRDNNVEVRYALNEAVKFSPQEEAAAAAVSTRSKLVNFALQYVGNRYVWGGTSLTNGVDCSGFTMRVMQQFGVSLPHYSGSQAKMGKKVTSASMKPGDLIFYGNSRGRVNHVAIYIGGGQIVHAASRKSGIKISTWNYRTPITIRSFLD